MFERIKTSVMAQATRSTVAHAITISKATDPVFPDRPYATHILVKHPGQVPYQVSGNYDMTLKEAEADYLDRIDRSLQLREVNP